jgi:hydrogenase maturation protein HypF
VPRLRLEVSGVVQGVGFRPFVYRTARELGLAGWVRNHASGVTVEVQGEDGALGEFVRRLREDPPPAARIVTLNSLPVPEEDGGEFVISASAAGGPTLPSVPADLATCPECLAEIRDPAERRFRYPFTNCTNCGPRYSIIASLPYDRPGTAMRDFELCGACRAEYSNPDDRRFHAQPVACPECGPRLELAAASGEVLALGEAALADATTALAAGRVVALKGIGGYQLLADATSPVATATLRERKGRPAKPFAVMFPGPAELHAYCRAGDAEIGFLQSSAAPILLLERRDHPAGGRPPLAAEVAPGNPYVGAMLPYSPLHHLLLGDSGRPLICTSGNLTDEPICIGDAEALDRLGAVADLFLRHDRPVLRPVDDSVATWHGGAPVLIRRARGYAPSPLPLAEPAPDILALGAHLKSTITLVTGGQAIVSQHLGDLHTPESVSLLERTTADLLDFFRATPKLLACDLHPDYASTRFAERLARELDVPLVRVQHHHAHVAAVLAEHAVTGPVLGLVWDGTGFGADGTIWGGEALLCDGAGYRRVAALRRFRLPGGEQAVREPRRSALGALAEMGLPQAGQPYLARAFAPGELISLRHIIQRGLNSPLASSMGRLFDAVAALAGLGSRVSFEAEAAMALQFAAETAAPDGAYPWAASGADPVIADWEPMVKTLLEDLARGVPASTIARRFHESLAELAVTLAALGGVERVALTGGCFQNRFLLDLVTQSLEAAGYEVLGPRAYPANDGGISLGQALIAARRWKEVQDVPGHTGEDHQH